MPVDEREIVVFIAQSHKLHLNLQKSLGVSVTYDKRP